MDRTRYDEEQGHEGKECPECGQYMTDKGFSRMIDWVCENPECEVNQE